jgi:chorismate mutase-like protein
MSLDDLRARIDRIDGELVRLLGDRARLAVEIGEIKRGRSAAIHDPAREDAVLHRAREANRGPLSDEGIENIYRAIIKECLRLEE